MTPLHTSESSATIKGRHTNIHYHQYMLSLQMMQLGGVNKKPRDYTRRHILHSCLLWGILMQMRDSFVTHHQWEKLLTNLRGTNSATVNNKIRYWVRVIHLGLLCTRIKGGHNWMIPPEEGGMVLEHFIGGFISTLNTFHKFLWQSVSTAGKFFTFPGGSFCVKKKLPRKLW